MSKSIEERIVDMQFNNAQFEAGVKQSIGSLDKLKKGLDLKDAGKNLSNLNDTAKKFSLAGIAEGVSTIAGKFTALGIVGVTALQNITSAAITAGEQFVSSLTIDPITDGFREYEMVLTAVQTTMAGTGKTAKEVQVELQKLDDYADQTVYSTADMLNNLPKFTNAGVKLQTATTAMIGIANATALAGGGADKASIAFYNLGQSIATGYLSRMDYNSINNAGIATMEWKEQMIAAAIAAGTLKKAKNGLYKIGKKEFTLQSLFIDGLQEQWATTEVLLKVFGDYGDATTDIGKRALASAQDIKTFTMMTEALKAQAGTGWKETWQLIFGDLDEAKVLWTGLGNAIGEVIGSSNKARNDLLQAWKTNGGREDLIQSFVNGFKALNEVLKPIKEAFTDIFPPITARTLLEMSEKLKEFTAGLKIGGETSRELKHTFKGFFAIFDIAGQAISAVVEWLHKLALALKPTGSSLLDMTSSAGDWLVNLDEMIRKGDVFNVAIGKMVDFIANIVTKIKEVIPEIVGFFKALKDGNIDELKTRFSNFGKVIGTALERIQARIGPLTEGFQKAKEIFSKIGEILKKIAPVFSKIGNVVGTAIDNTLDKISNGLDNADFSSITDLINSGLLAGILIGVQKFVGSMSEVTGGIAGILDGVKGALESWQSSLKADILLKIGIAVALLAASLIALSMIDSDKLQGALIAVSTSLVALFGSMAAFQKIMEGSVFKSMGGISLAMIGIAAAVLIFAFAMSKLSKLDWDGVAKGLVSVGVILGMLLGTAKLLSANTKGLIKGGLGFILIAAAINIMAEAVEKFSGMDTNALIQGLLGVSAVLAEVVVFTRLTGNAGNVLSTSLALTLLGASMLVFASAIGKLGNMSLEQIGKGLLAMAGALVIVGLALRLMPSNMVVTSIGLIGVAAAILILSNALQTMGGMTWEQVAIGLVVLAGSLGIIALAMQFMTTALPGAAALLIISVALTILSTALIAFGSMSLAELGMGLLVLAGVFAVLGLAGLLLAPLTPVLLGLSAAMALLGIGMLALGLGMTLFATGMAALAVSGAAGGAALVAVVKSLIELIPFILEQIGLGIIAFAKVITDGMPAIMEAVKAYFEGIMQLFTELAPPLIETLLNFVLEMLQKILEYAPKFLDTGLKIVQSFLQGIANNISGIVQAGLDIIINFLDGVSQKLPDVIQAAFTLIISFINGLADAIRNNHEAIYNACENMIDAIIDAWTSFMSRLPGVGENIVEGLISGVKSMGKALIRAAKGVVSSAIDAAKNLLGIHSPSTVFAEIGKNTGKGFIVGLEAMAGRVANASKELGSGSVNAMREAISGITDAIDSDVDMQPTIRPVIDMTDVESGLRNTFGKQQGINVDVPRIQASKISAANGQNGGTVGEGNKTTNTDNRRIVIKNSYTVRNDNDIRRISQDQKRLIDRYSLAKGVPAKA